MNDAGGTMEKKSEVRISLGGVLAQVAVVTLGMASFRWTLAHLSYGWYLRHSPLRYTHSSGGPLHFIELPYNLILVNGIPLLFLATISVLCLMWWSPTGDPGLKGRGQAFILCLVAVLTAGLSAAGHGIVFMMTGHDILFSVWRMIVFGMPPSAGHAVFGACVALGLLGPAPHNRSALDGAGYLMAANWVVLLVLEYLRWILEAAQLM